MANTYVKIASVDVGVLGAASMAFTSIPSTYTDLKIVCSTRQTGAAATASLAFTLNTLTTSFSYRALQGSGSAAASFSGSTGYWGQGDASTATANTFGNAEMYICNYAGSTNKCISADTVDENNATAAYAQLTAVLWSNTAAINAVSIVAGNGVFAQYSTATLYGISKS
jgi:hypothetical protein